MSASEWFLTAKERANPDTSLDSRHEDGAAWTTGNLVRPLVHGATYFAVLEQRVRQMRRGDLLMFVDWRGDPDERLTGSSDTTVGGLLTDAARRGVDVRGLVWRSHWDRLKFSSSENRHLGEEINAAGGQCHLDMRVRTGGSHHQKFLILRHLDRPELDIAFLGGIDLCHSRRDDAGHAGDPQPQSMAAAYGATPPWHDVQLAVTGPAVGDVEAVFRERWEDPQPLSRSPLRWFGDRWHGDQVRQRPLPPPAPDPAPVGPHPVQLLRTYPRRLGGYPFARRGERSVARGYTKAIGRARRLIYLEDQYLWSPEVATAFAEALQRHRELRLVAVLPLFPDQDGRLSLPPNRYGQEQVLTALRRAAPDRVACYGLVNGRGTPIYVHAKVCVIDDVWASVGSDNFNRRSWTHDSELSAAVLHAGYARDLRLQLAREHTGTQDDRDLLDPAAMFATFSRRAAELQRWRDGTRQDPRPAGQLVPLEDHPLPRATRAWAAALYRLVYDPDGRPLGLRRRHAM